MRSSSSYLLIIVLVIGLMFSLMYSASYLQQVNQFKPKISQYSAITTVQDDLKRLHPDFKELYILDDARHNYIPLSTFEQNKQHLPLIFVHENGTLLLVDTTSGMLSVWYPCTDSHYPYCSFNPPYNFDYKGRLIYGIDVAWVNAKGYDEPDIYAVDAMTDKIVDSNYLKNQTRTN